MCFDFDKYINEILNMKDIYSEYKDYKTVHMATDSNIVAKKWKNGITVLIKQNNLKFYPKLEWTEN